MAEKSTSQTSETEEEPNTQLTLTWPVLAITSAIRTTSKCDRSASIEVEASPMRLCARSARHVSRLAVSGRGDGDRRTTRRLCLTGPWFTGIHRALHLSADARSSTSVGPPVACGSDVLVRIR